MSSVYFQIADSTLVLKDKRKLKQFIKILFIEYGVSLHSLSVIFCSDDYLLKLNRQFLQHDYYTDILTFDLSINNDIIGEIYISLDRVKENAQIQKVTFNQELIRIIFHGALHLCGFGDKSALEKKKMTLKENKAIQDFSKFHVKQV